MLTPVVNLNLSFQEKLNASNATLLLFPTVSAVWGTQTDPVLYWQMLPITALDILVHRRTTVPPWNSAIFSGVLLAYQLAKMLHVVKWGPYVHKNLMHYFPFKYCKNSLCSDRIPLYDLLYASGNLKSV